MNDITFSALNIAYKNILQNININLYKGESLAIQGENGTGKSTLLKIFSTILKPDTGTITINSAAQNIKPVIGYLPEQLPLYKNMTVNNYLYWVFNLNNCQLNKNKDKNYIEHLCEQLDLKNILQTKISNLSKGLKQKVAIAQSIMHKPNLLLLDEPLSGLDHIQSKKILDLLINLKKNINIIITCHCDSEFSSICDRRLRL